MIYLASPYSHDSEHVREMRYMQTALAAARLIDQGFHVYSPICHSLGITRWIRDPWRTSFESWKEIDKDFISRSDSFIVLKLPGWEQSKGVQFEVEYAKQMGKPVSFVGIDEIT